MNKVAVLSADGVTVSPCPGRSGQLLIYAVEPGGAYRLLERRVCPKDPDPISRGVADCQVMVAPRIGPETRACRVQRGVHPVESRSYIGQALRQLG